MTTSGRVDRKKASVGCTLYMSVHHLSTTTWCNSCTRRYNEEINKMTSASAAMNTLYGNQERMYNVTFAELYWNV